MNKKFLIVLCILLITGCSSNKTSKADEHYIEKTKIYTVGEEKIIKEYVPEKEAYTESVLFGKTTSWGLKTRYEVGKGKDIEPGVYYINTNGWAKFNIFIGAVHVDLDNTRDYQGIVFLAPLEQSVCYISERDCPFGYYKKIGALDLYEGDILYASYTPYSDQGVSIRFEAQYVDVIHEKEEAQPEIKVQPLEIKESIRKYSDKYRCYINDYEVPNCDSLNYYDEIIKQFS